MVKIYKGVVVYQNIGNVVIPDAQVDDLKVNNIATINTLEVLDTLGLSNVKLANGTITHYAQSNYDIVNKKYVDDAVGTPFDPTQPLLLTGSPTSLTVKFDTILNGENLLKGNTVFYDDVVIHDNEIEDIDRYKELNESVYPTTPSGKLFFIDSKNILYKIGNYDTNIYAYKLNNDYTLSKIETIQFRSTSESNIDCCINVNDDLYVLSTVSLTKFNMNSRQSTTITLPTLETNNSLWKITIFNHLLYLFTITTTKTDINIYEFNYSTNSFGSIIKTMSYQNFINCFGKYDDKNKNVKDLYIGKQNANKIFSVFSDNDITIEYPLSINQSNVYAILEDYIGNLYIILCDTNTYICKYSKDGNYTFYTNENSIAIGACVDKNNNLYVIYENEKTYFGKLEYNINSNTHTYNNISVSHSDYLFTSIMNYKDTLIFGTNAMYIFIYRLNTGNLINYNSSTFNNNLSISNEDIIIGKNKIQLSSNNGEVNAGSVNVLNGTIKEPPINNFDIVNKKYVDDNKFDSTQPLTLSGSPTSLTVSNASVFNGTITVGTGNNQIQLKTTNGEITGKYLTLSEGIDCGTIKAGSGNTQITLDTQTGEIKGTFITSSSSITAGSGNNQILLNTSNGDISGKSLTISTGNLTVGSSPNQIILNSSNGNISGNSLSFDSNNIIQYKKGSYDLSYLQILSKDRNKGFIEIFNSNDENFQNGCGFQIYPANENKIKINGNTTFSNSVSLTSGTITSSPSSSNDIVNKAYVDAAISGGGFDPTQTLTLTNQNSLITNGNITTKTLLKTDNTNGESLISLENKYTISQSLNNPVGLFYCPSNKTLYTIQSDQMNTSYILKYHISTNTTSTVEIKYTNSGGTTYYMPIVLGFNGFYDYSESIPPYILITGRDSTMEHSYYCYYNIRNNTLSPFYTPIVDCPTSKLSYDGWIYYYCGESGVQQPYADLEIASLNDFYPSRGNHLFNLGFQIDYLLPLNSFNNFVIIVSGSTIYLYTYNSSSGTFNQLDIYNTQESSSSFNQLIYSDENESCYLFTNKKIYKIDVVKGSQHYELNVYLVYDNSSSNFNYRSGMINYDGTLYMFSLYSSGRETKIEQYIKIFNGSNHELKLISNKTLSNTRYSFRRCILTGNNEMWGIYTNNGNNNYYSIIGKINLNNNTLISNCQTSINGIIGINKNTPANIDTPPYNTNDILTVGTFFNLMKNFKCSGAGNIMNMDYLINNTFINSNKFINQSDF